MGGKTIINSREWYFTRGTSDSANLESSGSSCLRDSYFVLQHIRKKFCSVRELIVVVSNHFYCLSFGSFFTRDFSKLCSRAVDNWRKHNLVFNWVCPLRSISNCKRATANFHKYLAHKHQGANATMLSGIKERMRRRSQASRSECDDAHKHQGANATTLTSIKERMRRRSQALRSECNDVHKHQGANATMLSSIKERMRRRTQE